MNLKRLLGLLSLSDEEEQTVSEISNKILSVLKKKKEGLLFYEIAREIGLSPFDRDFLAIVLGTMVAEEKLEYTPVSIKISAGLIATTKFFLPPKEET